MARDAWSCRAASSPGSSRVTSGTCRSRSKSGSSDHHREGWATRTAARCQAWEALDEALAHARRRSRGPGRRRRPSAPRSPSGCPGWSISSQTSSTGRTTSGDRACPQARVVASADRVGSHGGAGPPPAPERPRTRLAAEVFRGPSEPLSYAFLAAGDVDPAACLVIGSMAVLDGPAPPVEGRARPWWPRDSTACPTYRQRLVPTGSACAPAWQDAPDLDLAGFVRAVGVPAPRRPARWPALITDMMARRMDRSRPLWDLTVYQGLPDGRWGVLMRVHHARGRHPGTGLYPSSSRRHPRRPPPARPRGTGREPAGDCCAPRPPRRGGGRPRRRDVARCRARGCSVRSKGAQLRLGRGGHLRPRRRCATTSA